MPKDLSPNPVIIPPLSSLHFFMALWIFVHHLYPVWYSELTPILGKRVEDFFVMGYVAVPCFFLLSGFSLFYGYHTQPLQDFSYKKFFWIKRFSRITPMFWLSLVVGFLPYLGGALKAEALSASVVAIVCAHTLMNFSYLGSLSSRALAMNYSSWSISVEAFLYFLFPTLAGWTKNLNKWGSVGMMAGALVFASFAHAVVFYLHPELYTWRADQFRPVLPMATADHLRVFLINNPISHIPEFAFGVALGKFSTFYKDRKKNPTLVLLLCATFGITIFWNLNSIPYLFLFSWLSIPITATAVFALSTGTGTIVRWMSHPKLLMLGEASYVLYIFHTPVRDWMSHIMISTHIRNTPAQYVVGVLYVPLFVWASVWLHYNVNIKLSQKLQAYLTTKFLENEEMAKVISLPNNRDQTVGDELRKPA